MKKLSSHKSKIKVRHPKFDFPTSTGKYWLNDSAFKTYIGNTLAIFAPQLENYGVRQIAKCVNEMSLGVKPSMLQDVRQMMLQEIQHELEHKKLFNVISSHGFKLNKYLKIQSFLLNFFSKNFSIQLNLSIVTVVEHIFASLSKVIVNKDFFKNSDETIRQFFLWHCYEEIEHKSVCLDLLNSIDSSYFLRLKGMFIGVSLISFSLVSATLTFLWQDQKKIPVDFLKKLLLMMLVEEKFLIEFIRALLNYLRPNFNPKQVYDLKLFSSIKLGFI